MCKFELPPLLLPLHLEIVTITNSKYERELQNIKKNITKSRTMVQLLRVSRPKKYTRLDRELYISKNNPIKKP